MLKFVWELVTGTEARSSDVCSSLSLRDLLWLNAVEWMVITVNASELLEEDRSLSLRLGLFPWWLCRWSKTRVGREEWGQSRET